MQYKLPEEFRGQYKEFKLKNNPIWKLEEVEVKVIRAASSRQMRNKHKFDISVEGHHNYMVGGIHNGVIVHNSPETQCGGQALKFYTSQRLEIRRKSTVEGIGEEKGKIIAIESKVKVVKNKVSRPFRETLLQIEFGKGINWAQDLLQTAEEDGLIERKGSWYSYKGEQLGQGAQATAKLISERPELAQELRDRLLQ
jgi:hypothetical protein